VEPDENSDIDPERKRAVKRVVEREHDAPSIDEQAIQLSTKSLPLFIVGIEENRKFEDCLDEIGGTGGSLRQTKFPASTL
jgi:hypothetical protein